MNSLKNRRVIFEGLPHEVIGDSKGFLTIRDEAGLIRTLDADKASFDVVPTDAEKKRLVIESEIEVVKKVISDYERRAAALEKSTLRQDLKFELSEIDKEIEQNKKIASVKKEELLKLEAELNSMKTQEDLENG